MDSDNYFNSNDLGDNQNVYTGLNYDNIRATAQASAPNNYYPPSQDSSGVINLFCFGSAHTGTFAMVFCDGSVHAISYTIDPETHRRLSNRSDGLFIDGSKL